MTHSYVTQQVSEGDYFGLDMLRLKKDLNNITLTVAHPFQVFFFWM